MSPKLYLKPIYSLQAHSQLYLTDYPIFRVNVSTTIPYPLPYIFSVNVFTRILQPLSLPHLQIYSNLCLHQYFRQLTVQALPLRRIDYVAPLNPCRPQDQYCSIRCAVMTLNGNFNCSFCVCENRSDYGMDGFGKESG
ncbi:hypothetical protein DPMN_023030 [Dreissena polymorpha]|uniref:Uncharacterized protein n=1 Tax=Dreissena polymorpha TaxID=45954 RepID=A0A9D4LLX8_DREPO|nr:hypothetical protein DPMN_023030 [Dreissena polymorpha]